MSGSKSRNKGKRGERDAAKWWRDNLELHGVSRTAQHRGSSQSADLSGTGRFHVEVKTGKVTPSVYDSVNQAKADCGASQFPLVQLKRDREEWLFVMPEETFIHMMIRYLEYESGK